jgi:hypothetical protein
MGNVEAMKAAGYCVRSDRDFPKMVCGYPLPCPHHTDAVVELDDETTTITLLSPAGALAGARIREIAAALRTKKGGPSRSGARTPAKQKSVGGPRGSRRR